MIKVLDTTLREGEQSPGVYFPPDRKLELARMLDEVGVDIIEVGNPMADPDIEKAVRNAVKMGLRARIGAHSRCKLEDVKRAIGTGATFVGVFISVSARRLELDYGLDLPAAIAQIQATVGYARSQSKDLMIRYTPEDAVRSKFEDVVAAAAAAVEAGANVISLADTTGFMSPWGGDERRMGALVAKMKAELAKKNLHPEIAVHCHNDRGLAIANALDACRSGAGIVDATVLGLGERTGIVDMAELMINLDKLPTNSGKYNLAMLPKLYDLVSHYAKRVVNYRQAVVGKDTFNSSMGLETKALIQAPHLYWSYDPAKAGREWSVSLGADSTPESIEVALKLVFR
ncbi:MAG: LeuA family protein, partial [Myxococcaceae bacterium]